jgi:hypothetical protein
VKASGAVSDGLFSIATDSKLNTDVSLDFQYNVMDLSKRYLTYYDDSFQAYKSKEKKIWSDFWLDSLSIMLHQQKNLLLLKDSNLKALEGKLTTAAAAETTVTARKDSLKYELAKVSFQRHLNSIAISEYPDQEQLLDTLENDRSMKLKTLKTNIELCGFQFGWFSIGYKVQRNSFRLFNDSAVYDNQIVKTNFISHEARLQYSYYVWSLGAYESYFLCGGLAFSYANNLSDLTAMEISEVKNYGPNPNDRTTKKKYNAYTGDYKKDIKGLRIYGDYYRFLFNENMAAVHIYPELQTRDKERPVWNIGFGFLLSFKDAKDVSSVVNAELYYNFLDVFHTSDSAYGLIERNDIGIRFSFPIKFKTQ